MSFKSKTAAALAALTLASAIALPASQAQAKPKWGLIGAGILGAAVVTGAAAATAAAAADPYYYGSPRHCFWQPRYDAFGNFIGDVRVCRYY